MSEDTRPLFDEKLAATYVGKKMLVGLTFLNEKGELLRREQIHGVIVSISKTTGIELSLHGANSGKTYWLPPDLRSTTIARPGEYSLKATNETVVDPDLLATWVFKENDPTGWHKPLKFYKAIFTNKDGMQRIASVRAKDLEEAITKLLAEKKPDENMNTPVEQ